MAIRYGVQSFRAKGRSLIADRQQSARTAEAAIAVAERLSMIRDGVF